MPDLIKLEVGQEFNSWTVLSSDYKSPGTRYRCKCICGNIRDVPSINLRHGHSKQCFECAVRSKKGRSFSPKTVPVGTVFGGWTKLSGPSKKIDGKRYSARWQCKCGHIQFLTTSNAKRGVCCKCCENKKLEESIIKRIWNSIVKHAYSRGLGVQLTQKQAFDLLRKQKNICALSGVRIEIAKTNAQHARGLTTASLDRIDSSVGYRTSNVQWIHKRLNWMKSNMPNDDFIEWCTVIADHNRTQNWEGRTSKRLDE